jgi:hypothetical protein
MGPIAVVVAPPPNTALQRTRSAPLRSPLSFRTLGGVLSTATSRLSQGKKLGVVLLVGVTVACAAPVRTSPAGSAAQPVRFEVAQTSATFGPTGILAAGTRFDFEIHALPKKHFFLAYKCGQPCNTAKMIMRVDGRGRDSETATLIIKETGSYYFWIEQLTEAGEMGTIFVSDLKNTPQGFSASFRDGTTVSGTVQIHD